MCAGENMPEVENELKQKIADLVREYYARHSSRLHSKRKVIQYGTRVYDEKEILALVDAALEFWLTYGWRSILFEKRFASYLGARYATLVNSGSSANLLAVAALCAPMLKEGLKAGDEVITPATTFPTTVNPLLLYGLRPVMVDSVVGMYNMDTSQLPKAITRKTRAIMIPHMLGNPSDLDVIKEIAERHDLFVVEDVCESLGSKFDGKFVGTTGDLSTFSFYASHHMTTGEGGAVCTSNSALHEIVVSLRDWGRGERHGVRESSLPSDYDKRYVYPNLGYNLRPLDLEAAIGLVQLRKLHQFSKTRRWNFNRLYEIFSKYEEYFVLPQSLPKADPVWFAFPLTVKANRRFDKRAIVTWLEKHGVETRSILAGNIIHQPAYRNFRFRKVAKLIGSDNIAAPPSSWVCTPVSVRKT